MTLWSVWRSRSTVFHKWRFLNPYWLSFCLQRLLKGSIMLLFAISSRKHTYIIFTPFYIVKLGFTGVYIIFLISAQNIHCGYALQPPRRGGSNGYPQSMFWAEIWKISEFFIWKFSVFLDEIFYIFEKACFRNVFYTLFTQKYPSENLKSTILLHESGLPFRPDQTLRAVESDLSLHCLLYLSVRIIRVNTIFFASGGCKGYWMLEIMYQTAPFRHLT